MQYKESKVNVVYFILTVFLTLAIEHLGTQGYLYILGKYKYRSIVGNYKHGLGTVSIKFRGGKRFSVHGIQTDGRVWSGEFVLQNLIGTGYYRWHDKSDWGHHELFFQDGGDVSVTWLNRSDSEFNSGTLIWKKWT